MIDVGDVRFDLDLRVDLPEMVCRGDRFRQPVLGVVLSEHRLPLQIRRLDEIAIDNTQTPDARAAQALRLGGPERAAADNKGARGLQPALPFFANSVEKNLSAVAIVHCVSV